MALSARLVILRNDEIKKTAVLLSNEREKKKKYLEACLDQVSCDGVHGNEAKVVLRNLAREAYQSNQESQF